MTPPIKIEGYLHVGLKAMVEIIAEHIWRESGGYDWIENRIDADYIQVILEEWIEKHFSAIVENKLSALVEEREAEAERERREEKETDEETRAWSLSAK